MNGAARPLRRLGWSNELRRSAWDLRMVAVETPIALAYGHCNYAVMMGTPADLTDFALGFSLSEGIIVKPHDLQSLRQRRHRGGLLLDMELAPGRMDSFWQRRRHLAGPAGCGLCGVESIDQALRPDPKVKRTIRFSPREIAQAMAALPALQKLNRETRAVHAAGFWLPQHGFVAVREDVGRHNALDKLIGALARGGAAPENGIVVLTSRLSVELVQKAAMAGIPVVAGVSAPTSLAVTAARRAGITLIGVVRPDGFETFSHVWRIRCIPARKLQANKPLADYSRSAGDGNSVSGTSQSKAPTAVNKLIGTIRATP